MTEPRRRKPPPPAPGLTDLMRGPLDAITRLAGIDRATRSLERLSASADRAAKILDSLDEDRLERLLTAAEAALAEVEQLSGTISEMNQSLKAIERFLIDTRAVLQPLDRLPIPRSLRRSRRASEADAT